MVIGEEGKCAKKCKMPRAQTGRMGKAQYLKKTLIKDRNDKGGELEVVERWNRAAKASESEGTKPFMRGPRRLEKRRIFRLTDVDTIQSGTKTECTQMVHILVLGKIRGDKKTIAPNQLRKLWMSNETSRVFAVGLALCPMRTTLHQ